MIVCSCNVISDRDIEFAVIDIMGAPNAPIPTPGVVFRHLSKRMNCCKCAPVAVATIYAAMDRLAAGTRVCPFILAEARAKLIRLEVRRQRREAQRDALLAERAHLSRVA
ncbi:MAG: bacterioferritin-associated ferredoxin [Hyphomicrobium sp.]